MKKLLPLVAILLLGSGCVTPTASVSQVPSSQTQDAPPPAPTVGKGVVSAAPKPGYSTYENASLGFALDVPTGWKLGEYGLDSSVSVVAFDPVAVITQDDFDSLDEAPGRFMIAVTDALPAGVTSTVIGQGIPAKFVTTRYGSNSPNPFWLNRTDRVYYLASPKQQILQIEIQYPNAVENDAAQMKAVNDMLASFRFLK